MNSKDILNEKVQVSHAKEQFIKPITTGTNPIDLQEDIMKSL
jgi:hypothetical protein